MTCVSTPFFPHPAPVGPFSVKSFAVAGIIHRRYAPVRPPPDDQEKLPDSRSANRVCRAVLVSGLAGSFQ